MQHSNKLIRKYCLEQFHLPVLQELSLSLLSSVSFNELQDNTLASIKIDIPIILDLLHLPLTPDFKVHLHNNTILEDSMSLIIIGPDLPFLVDSIVNHLKANNLDITLITHRAISPIRNTDGKVVSIDDSQSNPSVAIMYLHLEKHSPPPSLSHMIKKILQITQCLTFSFHNWKNMTTYLEEIANDTISLKAISDPEERSETVLFLKWLAANNFIFLGSFVTNLCNKFLEPDPSSYMGICTSPLYPIERTDIIEYPLYDEYLFMRKWEKKSVIHHTAHMDWLVVKRFDNNGNCVGTINFLGFFTSSVYYQCTRSIPLIRRKINNVIKRYGYREHSHNCKELITAIEGFSREELLQMSEDELYETATGIVSLILTPRVKLFVRPDRSKTFIYCTIFIPQARFSTAITHTVEKLLCERFKSTISKQHVQINNSQLARIQITLKTESHLIPSYNIHTIEQEISTISSLWSDDLFDNLCDKYDRSLARDLYLKFRCAFDTQYTSTFSAKQAIHDIRIIEESISANTVKFFSYIRPYSRGIDTLQLKIYSPYQELPLSSTLPKLENLGLYTHDMTTYETTIRINEATTTKVFIYHFHLQPSLNLSDFTASTIDNLVETLNMLWSNAIDNDRFNNLILNSHLNWRQALIFRSYNSYLKQINFPLTAAYILNTMLHYSTLTSQLSQLFELKFNPDLPRNEEAIITLQTLISEGLQNVSSRSQEKVMSTLHTLINATKRTNFYQKDCTGHYKSYLSFKISSGEIVDIPLPRPYAEIFVYSIRFRGIHLRGGKISRGGIRWSDRSEDMRTEILGLMKAQMTKNAVIVPVGSKGGFVLKQITIENGREQFTNEGLECYRLFLSGLLDITDNIIDGKVVAPNRVIRYDADDPYLVVAADKGTATFSDEANNISQEYNFWLSDAFASGGSTGYDHKKLGITARGAWISVINHFSNIGIDIKKTEFSAIGIGDMSGDVFGNGMLLSDKVKLLAAFNHKHIFLDPSPDPKTSLIERKRLFELPHSQWSDYNSNLISSGGGIFSRDAKHINISSEVKQALAISSTSLTPDELISAILKAPVDLLWNGGIGTYVKAENETHEMVGDKINDSLRINGSALRCKVIGEGGNLGMTQLGRIEYAHNGGKLNTDFIDNSAGVDCSDHEVNIKIILNNLVKAGNISLKERNIILKDMAQEVSELVLQDNTQQALLLSLEEHLGNTRMQEHAWLIKHFSDNGILNCKIEFLPTPETISVILANNKQLTRPEIAILISYAKNSMFYILSEIDFVQNALQESTSKDIALESFISSLLNYFPTPLRKRFMPDLLQHKLRNEIISTVSTNSFINMLGCTLFHQLKNNGESPLRIIQSFFIVKKIFDVDELWKAINQSKLPNFVKNRLSLLSEIQLLITINIEWILHHHDTLTDIHSIVKDYKPNIACILESLPTKLDTLNKSEAQLCILRNSREIMNIINITQRCNQPLHMIIAAYFAINDRLHFGWMKQKTNTYTNCGYVDKMALKNLANEIENIHMQLTLQHFTMYADRELLECTIPYSEGLGQYNKLICEIKEYTGNNLIAMLVMALHHAKNFLKDIKTNDE